MEGEKPLKKRGERSRGFVYLGVGDLVKEFKKRCIDKKDIVLRNTLVGDCGYGQYLKPFKVLLERKLVESGLEVEVCVVEDEVYGGDEGFYDVDFSYFIWKYSNSEDSYTKWKNDNCIASGNDVDYLQMPLGCEDSISRGSICA